MLGGLGSGVKHQPPPQAESSPVPPLDVWNAAFSYVVSRKDSPFSRVSAKNANIPGSGTLEALKPPGSSSQVCSLLALGRLVNLAPGPQGIYEAVISILRTSKEEEEARKYRPQIDQVSEPQHSGGKEAHLKPILRLLDTKYGLVPKKPFKDLMISCNSSSPAPPHPDINVGLGVWVRGRVSRGLSNSAAVGHSWGTFESLSAQTPPKPVKSGSLGRDLGISIFQTPWVILLSTEV